MRQMSHVRRRSSVLLISAALMAGSIRGHSFFHHYSSSYISSSLPLRRRGGVLSRSMITMMKSNRQIDIFYNDGEYMWLCTWMIDEHAAGWLNNWRMCVYLSISFFLLYPLFQSMKSSYHLDTGFRCINVSETNWVYPLLLLLFPLAYLYLPLHRPYGQRTSPTLSPRHW